jgi:hypothetical protein
MKHISFTDTFRTVYKPEVEILLWRSHRNCQLHAKQGPQTIHIYRHTEKAASLAT